MMGNALAAKGWQICGQKDLQERVEVGLSIGESTAAHAKLSSPSIAQLDAIRQVNALEELIKDGAHALHKYKLTSVGHPPRSTARAWLAVQIGRVTYPKRGTKLADNGPKTLFPFDAEPTGTL